MIAQLQRRFDLVGQRFECVDDARSLRRREMAHSAQQQSDQCQDGHLRGERFRRGDADLRSGVHVNAAVAFARDRAGDVVADAERAKSFALAFAQGAQRVGGLAALADGENERVAAHRRVAMAKLAGVFHFHRNVRELFDEIFARPSRRVMRCRSRSARRGRHRAIPPRVMFKSAELGGAFFGAEPSAHGVAH